MKKRNLIKGFLTSVALFLICSIYFSEANADTRPYWIFFTDRGNIDAAKIIAAKKMSPGEPKNSSRRAKLATGKLFDERDLPVNPEYIAAIKALPSDIRTVTRYFNGVTAELDDDMIETVRNMPFVKEISPVKEFKKPSEPVSPETGKNSNSLKISANYEYGFSSGQLNLIKVPELHKMGYLGEGIRIAILDSGFRNLQHTAFDSLKVYAMHDFVDGGDDLSDDDHGSEVLSVLAALDKGKLIGAAPYAEYILARTEIRSGNDTKAEEDYWVAGLEWADSLGVDVVNSSVGYNEFEGGGSYTYQDLNGITAITSIAADIAVSKGISVVVSAGNEADNSWYYIVTPADAINVISVGSVDINGVISDFSSRGPTPDGRIKPELVALGEKAYVVNSATQNAYQTVDGTSYSAPAVSGAVALILQANPSWGPLDARTALISTASKGVTAADSIYGYGIPNAFAASGLEPPETPVTNFKALDPYPQPFNIIKGDSRMFFPIEIPSPGKVLIDIFSFSGDRVRSLSAEYTSSGRKTGRTEAPGWDGLNFTGDDVSPGVYFYSISFGGSVKKGKIALIR